jgi:hypothetical protein
MNDLDLPPFPAIGEKGPHVCERVRLYLAIVDELPFEQVGILSEHVRSCEGCAAEFRQLQEATRLLASLPESIPSARVDAAILAALKSGSRSLQLDTEKPLAVTPRPRLNRQRRPISARQRTSLLALAAAILLVLTLGILLRGLIFHSTDASAFHLPANLSWNGYVLHYTQNKLDAQGRTYQVEVYQDLATNNMHIESSMEGMFDVVVVTDNANMLGKDMMHRVAQKGSGVENWAMDGSIFDLSQLRQELATRRALYLGKGTFQGEDVYQIRVSSGQVLLLTMQYLPAGVLRAFNGPGTGISVYKTFALMSSAQISESMWNMQVPAGFRMGSLPTSS